MDDYDVFLNHRGADVKVGFVARLHDALTSAGLNPFLDKLSLVKGDPLFGAIDKAMQVAKIHVAVVSRGYPDSNYCLSELVAMLKSGKPVIPVFYDVEPAELRRHLETGRFAAAFEKHRSREKAEQVQEWIDALHKLADNTGFCLSEYKGDEMKLVKEVVEAILSLTPTTTALQVDCHLVALDEHMNTCVNKLEGMSISRGLLCLVGMAGIGKTSLAKRIYNHLVGQNKFKATSFLEIDRHSPSNIEVGSSTLTKLQKQLLWDLLRIPDTNQHNYMYWFNKLFARGPILVVLDDIHEENQFGKLILDANLLAPGSCIIVTSRDRHLLKIIGGNSNFYLHEVTPLGCDDSEKLFNWHAFGNEEAPENFKVVASDVSKSCGGLPLALKVVGSSLFDKKSDEDLDYIWPEARDALKENPNVINALRWSYTCLLESEKLMFVDIACIFHGWKKQEALEIWKSCKKCSSCCGSGIPYTTLRHLIDKSLIELEDALGKEILTVHSLLRDFGQNIGLINGSHLWEDKATKVVEDNNDDLNKVRALNLANSWKNKFEAEKFAKMSNLHFLVLDGCDISGNLGNISKELRWLRWRNIPLTYLPPMLDLSNLISLDFSQSTQLANAWAESNPTLEACPNLLRLNLSDCTSLTTLPDSVGHLSKLQFLDLHNCKNLQQLPSSIGQLTALKQLMLQQCESLEALPDAITSLSQLQRLHMDLCTSVSKLPTSIGLMTSLTALNIDLATEGQASGVGELPALKELFVTQCFDEVITLLDSSATLKNLHQLSDLYFFRCASMTKLPETIGLLQNLHYLDLYGCEKLQELPKSIGELKELKTLYLWGCNSLETLPDCLGELTSLEHLWFVQCSSITEIPASIGCLSRLHLLRIQGCIELQLLPKSVRLLNALHVLTVTDCGSLENLGTLRALQGLRIWGCTALTELPGSRILVLDSNSKNTRIYFDVEGEYPVRRDLKEVQVMETNDCGFLRLMQDAESGRSILQRVHKLPCCKITTL